MGKKTIVRAVIAVFSLALTAVLIAVPIKVAAEFKRVFSLTSEPSSVSVTVASEETSPTEVSDTHPASEAVEETTEAVTEEKHDFQDEAYNAEIQRLKDYDGVNWSYDGIVYVEDTKDVPKYKKLQLKVPSYKQDDIRWKHRRIGWRSTVGSVGCATTALAMAESFHQGKTITPADMVDRLSYTPSGRVYWPSEYREERINRATYIFRIYKLLSKGKPVVLGMRTPRGSEHWVIVTGYAEYDYKLKVENFKINDPGTDKRKRLSDFVSEYSVPYKIVYRK